MTIIAFDTETQEIGLTSPPDPDKSSTKANVRPVPKMVCLSYARLGDGKVELLGADDAVEQWLDWIRADDVHLIGANVAFDMAVMVRAAEERGHDPLDDVLDAYNTFDPEANVAGRISDVLIRQRLLDYAQLGYAKCKGLASLEDRLLADDDLDRDHERSSTWRTRYQRLDDIPVDQWPEEARRYALDDAAATLDCWQIQQAESVHVEHQGTQLKVACPTTGVINEAFQARAAFHLQLAATWGIRLDAAKIDELGTHFRDQKPKAEAKLQEHGLHDGTSKNEQAIRDRVNLACQRHGIEPERTGKTNKVSMSSSQLEDLRKAGCDAEWMDALDEYRRVDKAIGTYIEALEAALPYRIAPSYRVMRSSGRTSSKKPNIQNIPAHAPSGDRRPELRECFKSRKGRLFVGADYSQLELRTLAQAIVQYKKLAGMKPECRLQRKLNEGLDPHLLVASQMLSIDYDTAVERYGDGDKAVSKRRELAKIVNYGRPAGMRAATLSDQAESRAGVEMTKQDGERLLETWFDTWPGAEWYFKSMVPRLNEAYDDWNGDFRMPQFGPGDGRTFWRLRKCRKISEAANTTFQGLAADGALAALSRIIEECYVDTSSPLYGARPAAFIHDEFIAEVPREQYQAAAERLSELMVAGMERFTPDVDQEAEPEAMTRWSKDAESRYSDGRLEVYGIDYS